MWRNFELSRRYRQQNGTKMMHHTKPFPDQIDCIFRDHFSKWPRRFKWTVFFCFCFPISVYFALTQGTFAPSFVTMMVLSLSTFNTLVVFWGLKLNSFAQRYWHRNYHISGAVILSLLPLSTLVFQYTVYCL